MTKEQAKALLDQALANMKLTRQEHQLLIQALAVLTD
jgi:hypothetical protein